MKKVDTSSEALTRRLRQTDQLRELLILLMKAKADAKQWRIEKQNVKN